MAHRLDEDENRPQRGRGDRDEYELQRAVGTARRGRRESREHERERRHDDQRSEPRAGSLDAKRLLVVREAAHQDACPTTPVQMIITAA